MNGDAAIHQVRQQLTVDLRIEEVAESDYDNGYNGTQGSYQQIVHCVVNTDIQKGDTIEDSEISFITISAEEYESLCGSHIVNDDGSVVQDKPVFFVDRTRDIVNKFATTDLAKGDILMLSSVSAQQTSEDMYVVETEDENGNRQTQTIDGAALESDATIEYYARVTTSSGETYEIPLSSILLRNKTVEDILNEVEDLDLSLYTEKSSAVFRTALANAQAVMADETLTEEDQKTVDEAVQALIDAKEQLRLKDGSGGEEDFDSDNNSVESADVPKTGDTRKWILLVGIMLVSAGAVSVLRKKSM